MAVDTVNQAATDNSNVDFGDTTQDANPSSWLSGFAELVSAATPVILAKTSDTPPPRYDPISGQWVYAQPTGYYGQPATTAASQTQTTTRLIVIGVLAIVAVLALKHL